MEKLLIDSNLLYHLISLGDIVPLDITLNVYSIKEEIQIFEKYWKQYNPRKNINREGLSITSLDGSFSGVPDLDSLFEYNKKTGLNINEISINVKTEVAKINSLRPLLNLFTIGRSHFIRLNKGGFFPPHRDGKILNVACFRIITLCDNCKNGQFEFIYDNHVLNLEVGRSYFINTRKTHSVFSYVDNSIQCILNVPLTQKNVNTLITHVQFK